MYIGMYMYIVFYKYGMDKYIEIQIWYGFLINVCGTREILINEYNKSKDIKVFYIVIWYICYK